MGAPGPSIEPAIAARDWGECRKISGPVPLVGSDKELINLFDWIDFCELLIISKYLVTNQGRLPVFWVQ